MDYQKPVIDVGEVLRVKKVLNDRAAMDLIDHLRERSVPLTAC